MCGKINITQDLEKIDPITPAKQIIQLAWLNMQQNVQSVHKLNNISIEIGRNKKRIGNTLNSFKSDKIVFCESVARF